MGQVERSILNLLYSTIINSLQAYNDNTERYWLVAYVKMHHERKVRECLDRMGIENFLPVSSEIRQWSDRKKKVERVLTPMMIFVYVNDKERDLVLSLSAVTRYLVLRGEHQPARIPNEQMERFRFMTENTDDEVFIESETFINGEKVRVIKGPLKDLEGELIRADGSSRLGVRVNSLGFATVQINQSWVEKV